MINASYFDCHRQGAAGNEGMTQTGHYIKPSEQLPGQIISESTRKRFRVFPVQQKVRRSLHQAKLSQSELKGTKVRTTDGGSGAALLTLETVSGMLKSFPPCSLKPQGPGPGRDTV